MKQADKATVEVVLAAKRVWEIVLRKAVLDQQTRVYTVQFTPEEMEAITTMSKSL